MLDIPVYLTTREPSEIRHGRSPLLFIHGSGHGAWCWEEHFLDYFAESGYVSAALDLRGHGRSPGRAELSRLRLADYVDDVLGVMAALRDRYGATPVLIGHSLGGAIIQRIVDDRLATPPAAILLSPIPRAEGWKISSASSLRTFGLIRLMRIVLQKKSRLMYASERVTRRAFFAHDMPADLAQTYWEHLQDESWMDGDVGRFASTRPEPRPEVPMFFISGSEDEVFPPKAIETTAHYYHADYQTIDGVAHDMMLDPGWKRVADALRTWLGQRQ